MPAALNEADFFFFNTFVLVCPDGFFLHQEVEAGKRVDSLAVAASVSLTYQA